MEEILQYCLPEILGCRPITEAPDSGRRRTSLSKTAAQKHALHWVHELLLGFSLDRMLYAGVIQNFWSRK